MCKNVSLMRRTGTCEPIKCLSNISDKIKLLNRLSQDMSVSVDVF